MQFNLDKMLGLNQAAVKIHSRRSEVLAGNLANVDTPGFKARDIDFKTALQRVKGNMNTATLKTTNPRHLGISGNSTGHIDDLLGEMKYRVPSQPSLDGNTVDSLAEKSAFMENALLYQTNLKFLNGKIKNIKRSLKGE
jgi:flagellar basal-body rod protein FlgB